MKVAVAQIPLFTEQQIAEETLQKDGCEIYSLRNIVVVGTYKSIAEIPRVFCEQVIVYIKSQRTQILYGENGRSAGVTLAKVNKRTNEQTNKRVLSFSLVVCKRTIYL